MTTDISELLLTTGSVAALAFVVKLTLIVAAGLLAARLAACASASLRHHILACTFAALLLLPIAAMLVPPLAIDVPIHGPPAPASLEQAFAVTQGMQPLSSQPAQLDSTPRVADVGR